LYTEGIDYTAEHLLRVSRVHARHVQKSFLYFNYSAGLPGWPF